MSSPISGDSTAKKFCGPGDGLNSCTENEVSIGASPASCAMLEGVKKNKTDVMLAMKNK
jgi:hypothetical protein